MVQKIIKKWALYLLRYLSIAIPMGTLLLLPIYLYGDELGDLLIQKYGDTVGLYIRPLVMSITYTAFLALLLSPPLRKVNQALWLKQLSDVQISHIYKTYIYAITSFTLITLLVVIKTIFFYTEDGINWFNTKDHLFVYLLAMLVIAPAFNLKTKN